MSELKTDAIQFCIDNADWTSDSSVIDAPKELAALLAEIERLRGECENAERRGFTLAIKRVDEILEIVKEIDNTHGITYEEAKAQERGELP